MIEETLEQRGSEYGDWSIQASVSQGLKEIIRIGPSNLNRPQMESIDLILMKISRIVVGNPDNIDSWTDIIGYATLAIKEIEKNRDA